MYRGAINNLLDSYSEHRCFALTFGLQQTNATASCGDGLGLQEEIRERFKQSLSCQRHMVSVNVYNLLEGVWRPPPAPQWHRPRSQLMTHCSNELDSGESDKPLDPFPNLAHGRSLAGDDVTTSRVLCGGILRK